MNKFIKQTYISFQAQPLDTQAQQWKLMFKMIKI